MKELYTHLLTSKPVNVVHKLAQGLSKDNEHFIVVNNAATVTHKKLVGVQIANNPPISNVIHHMVPYIYSWLIDNQKSIRIQEYQDKDKLFDKPETSNHFWRILLIFLWEVQCFIHRHE